MPDRKAKPGIEAHCADLESERQRRDAAENRKQQLIDEGDLLDLEAETTDGAARAKVADSYLGDSIENLTDAHLKPWQTYGAGRGSGASARSKRKPKLKRGRPFQTKEAEPRSMEIPTRTTSATKDRLSAYKLETGRNPSDVLMLFGEIYAAASNGNHAAALALRIVDSYARQTRVGEMDPGTRKLLSVVQKGLPKEAA